MMAKVEKVGSVGGIDKKNNDGNSPLHCACKGGSAESVQILLDVGASIDLTNIDGDTPLHIATRERHGDIVKKLLVAGACPSIENKSGETPWHIAAASSQAAILALFKESTLEFLANETCSKLPLHEAVKKNDIEKIKTLIRNGASVNETDQEGKTPLYLASAIGHEETVKILLNAGADQWAQTVDGSTAIHAAARAGNVTVLKLLSEKTESTHAELPKSKYETIPKKTPLKSTKDAKKNKIKSWTDIYKLSDIINSIEIDEDQSEEEFSFDLKESLFRNFLKIFNSPKIDRVKYEGLRGEVEKYLNHLLKLKDTNVNADIWGGVCLLHMAVISKSKEAISQLLQRKANVNAKMKSGMLGCSRFTPLFLAIKLDYLDIAKMLIEKGADIKIKDDFQRTPLHLAAFEGSTELVTYLLSVGFNPNAKDAFGNTPLKLAFHNHENPDVTDVLIRAGADLL